MIQIIALVLGGAASYLPHLVLGERLSFFADFAVGTVVGGVVYVASIYYLKKARGDF